MREGRLVILEPPSADKTISGGKGEEVAPVWQISYTEVLIR